MAISGDYPSPVVVNGYLCWNCTDVDHAHEHVDPAHPNDGPFGVDATGAASGDPGLATPAYQPGSRLNVSA